MCYRLRMFITPEGLTFVLTLTLLTPFSTIGCTVIPSVLLILFLYYTILQLRFIPHTQKGGRFYG